MKRRPLYHLKPYSPPVSLGPAPHVLLLKREDIEAADRLGPLTRAVVKSSPRDIEVRDFIAKWRHEHLEHLWLLERPVDDPEVDAHIAAWLSDVIRRRFGTAAAGSSPHGKRSAARRT